ncbi:MAG: hypothetical protein F6K24_35640 [Okeania sp. SIO2D1]|nr:hypothetical protein [Okeania sp. SIO2D1]
MATCYIKAIQTVRPIGPYYLGGWSFCGVVAWEMARQLQVSGQEVALLALIDSYTLTTPLEQIDEAFITNSLLSDLGAIFGSEFSISDKELQQLQPEEQLSRILTEAKPLNILPPDIGIEQMGQLFEVFKANLKAMYDYRPLSYSGQTVLFCTSYEASEGGWSSLAAGTLEVYTIPGDHYGIMQEPHVQVLAKHLETCLESFVRQ